MATLERIRRRGVLLVVTVGLAMFAFIIGDFLNSSQSFFGQQKMKVAVIDGKTIKYPEFQSAIDQLTTVYKIETGQTGNDQMNEQIREQVWSNFLNSTLIGQQAAELGLTVTKEEMNDLTIGDHISPLITGRRIFVDPQTGAFSKQALLNFLTALNQAAQKNNPQQADEIKQYEQYWDFWVKMIKDNTLQQKYITLLSKTITSNALDAKYAFSRNETSVDMNFIMQPYYTIPDGSITVSDAEIKALYKKQIERYRQEANNDFKYVLIPIKPSQADFSAVEQKINGIKANFETAADNQLTTIINNNSDSKYIDAPLSKEDLPTFLQDFAFNGKKGDVFGPTLENDTYVMAKIIEPKMMLPDSVNIRHIFVAAQSDTATSILADSIKKAINGGADFAALARKYSRVQQTAANGGEIGWVQEQNLLQMGFNLSLANKIFQAAKNEIVVDKEPQGIQLIQVTQQRDIVPKVKLGIIAIRVVPSDATREQYYNQAKQFATAATSLSNFDATAKAQGLVVHTANQVDPNAPQIGMIKNSRSVIRWVNDNKVGTVSDVLECGAENDQLIVAVITGKHEKGYRSLEAVTPDLKAQLITDKKAQLMIKNISSAMATNPTLPGLAATLKVKMDTATNLNFYSNGTGSLTNEPLIIGAATASQANKISQPLQGKMGVYVFNVYNIQTKNDPFVLQNEEEMLNQKQNYMLPYIMFQVLKDKGNIQDYRARFF
jgi:peptidyl-prolyl cis-trans isomerase D